MIKASTTPVAFTMAAFTWTAGSTGTFSTEQWLFLTAADGGLLNTLVDLARIFNSGQVNLDLQPIAEELAESSADEDANDDVAVEVHGEQHDDVRAGKGSSVDECAGKLLDKGHAEGHGPGNDLGDAAGAALSGECGAVGGGTTVKLAHEKGIVLLAEAAEELDENDEENDADAGGGEGALGRDAPGRAQEAGIDGVPVPQHLPRGVRVEALRRDDGKVTHINLALCGSAVHVHGVA
jgi:hypothetical protein